MSDSAPAPALAGEAGLLQGRGKETMKEGLWENNPISVQILGICSALAITNTLANSLVMGAALVFVGGAANLVASALRDYTPGRIRLIVEMAIIATLVILVDQFLKGFYWDMSKRLGPYVGLIITNCIVLGRVEAFSLQNPPMLSVVDGVANGLGYAAILAIIGLFRELLGSGEVFGFTVLSADWYPPNQLMILAPGAFLGLGFLIALFNVLHPPEEEEE